MPPFREKNLLVRPCRHGAALHAPRVYVCVAAVHQLQSQAGSWSIRSKVAEVLAAVVRRKGAAAYNELLPHLIAVAKESPAHVGGGVAAWGRGYGDGVGVGVAAWVWGLGWRARWWSAA